MFVTNKLSVVYKMMSELGFVGLNNLQDYGTIQISLVLVQQLYQYLLVSLVLRMRLQEILASRNTKKPANEYNFDGNGNLTTNINKGYKSMCNNAVFTRFHAF